MRAEHPVYQRSVLARRRRRVHVRRLALAGLAVLALVALLGYAFAGSSARLAEGAEVAGVDVGGLSAAGAVRELRSRAEAVARTPVTFVAAGRRFEVSASQLGVEADWRGAVAAAEREGDGFGPVRGFRRLHTRFFGAEVDPGVSVFRSALEFKLDQIAGRVDRPAVAASVERRGLRVAVVPGRTGIRLQRAAAAEAIVRALAGLERGAAVTLPVVSTPPSVTAPMLQPAAAKARTALSGRVHLEYRQRGWHVPRWRIAELLSLPRDGATEVAVAGPAAEAYLAGLARRVDRKPVDARFAVTAGRVRVVPSRSGVELDVPATLRALTAAAFAPASADRAAVVVVREAVPERTTTEASAMGITGVVASYTTTYGGTPGRLHNVQLVASLIDDTLIAPGEVFSFNDTTGERTAEKGFEEAPVIINGELQTGLGGGVCQVSTTVFNAAFDAGLPIEERTNHALYISHYPLGRDATVNYPDLDLRFRNDTGRWLLLRTFVGSGSLTVNLYGAPLDRRVETEATPLRTTGPVPVREIKDPTLERGVQVTEEVGAPPRATNVRRTVYAKDGSMLYDSVWYSSYVGEPAVVRVGAKKPPPKQPKPGAVTKAGEATAAGDAVSQPAAPVPATPRP